VSGVLIAHANGHFGAHNVNDNLNTADEEDLGKFMGQDATINLILERARSVEPFIMPPPEAVFCGLSHVFYPRRNSPL